MRSKWNKVLSWLLTVTMLVSSFTGMSLPVLADGEEAIVSVNAISANGFDAEEGKDGSSAEAALNVSVSVGDAVTLSFNTAVVSGNEATVWAGESVSWNLTNVDDSEAELPAGLEAKEDANVFVISGNATASANATFKLSASYNGAATKAIFFSVEVKAAEEISEPEEPVVSANTVTISANGFSAGDGKTKESAYTIAVSNNEAFSVSFDAAVVSANGVVLDETVSWNFVNTVSSDFVGTASGNTFTVSGASAVSANNAFELTATSDDASATVFFNIKVGEVSENEAEPEEPVVSENSVTVSANGFSAGDGKTKESAYVLAVSNNEAFSVSFDAAVVSANGVVLDETVSWNFVNTVSSDFVGTASGNTFTVSGASAVSANNAFELTATSEDASTTVFFNIKVGEVSENEVEPEEPVVSANTVTISANGFSTGDGKTKASAYTLAVSNNEAFSVSFDAAVVSANGVVLDETVSWNLTPSVNGITGTASGNTFTVSGASAVSANNVFELTASSVDASTTVFFNIKVGEVSENEVEPVKPEEPGIEIVEGIKIVGLAESYDYTGAQIKPDFQVVDTRSGEEIVLAKGTDYTVKYGKNKEANGTVSVKGKGNYAGKSVDASFAIVKKEVASENAADLKGAKVQKIAAVTFNGKEQTPETIAIKFKGQKEAVTFEFDGENYVNANGDVATAAFSNNINKGTAAILLSGKDGSSVKAKFKITAADISAAELISIDEASWAVKAVNASAEYALGDYTLVAGQDYKATFKAKTVGEEAGQITVKGKGNFKGSKTNKFAVKALAVEDANVIVSAVEGKAKKAKVQVVDNAGYAVNKKFYKVSISENAEAKEVQVTITATSKANGVLDIPEDGFTKTVALGADFTKAKISVAKGFSVTYTGEAITLDQLEEDPFDGKIAVTVNKKPLVCGTDFEVVSYKNNVKKGTMIVTLAGIGEYSGIKTFKVKIAAKSLAK